MACVALSQRPLGRSTKMYTKLELLFLRMPPTQPHYLADSYLRQILRIAES